MFAKTFLAALAGSAIVAAAGNETVVTTTEVVSKYTTYCPEATQVTMGNKTYTVTAATTLTILDCPCTIVKTSTGMPKPTNNVCPGGNCPPNNGGNNGNNGGNNGNNGNNGGNGGNGGNVPVQPTETGSVTPVTGGAEQKQAAYGLAVAGALAALAL